MDNLPFENLQEIFSQLHQRDKVECLTVCRAWRCVLKETIKCINEEYSHVFAYLILKRDVCPLLTELTVCGKYHGNECNCLIYLDNLLEKIESTLTTLTLTRFHISSTNLSSIPACRNIKTLALQKCILPKSMDRYISQAFSNLRTLIVKHCTWRPPAFYLNNLNLFYLEFVDSFPDNNKYVLIDTL